MSVRQVLLIVLLGWTLTACAGLIVGGGGGDERDTRSASEMDSDARITRDINRALIREPAVSAVSVRVSTYRGVVTVSGTVENESDRYTVLRLARRVSGVKSVRDKLRIR